MKNSEHKQFDNAVDFVNMPVSESINNFKGLLEFLEEFTPIFEKEKEKLPYHFNLIDVLGAKEIAHSRILEKLLKHKEITNERFEILESFILFIREKYKDKKDFQKIIINYPRITKEEKRIDLWIRDKDYSIIIENKIHWAKDTEKQLSNYINITKKKGFREDGIYVLYLPPTYEKQPEEQSWGVFLNGDIHKKRFLVLSFREDILPWIKDCVLPNIREKDKSLHSAIEQYIDHLEGMFNLRNINKEMNEKLQKIINDKMKLTGAPLENFAILYENKEVIEQIIKQVDLMKKNIAKEIFPETILKWKESLELHYDNYVKEEDPNYAGVHIPFIPINGAKIVVTLHYEDDDLICLIETYYSSDKGTFPMEVVEIAKNLGFEIEKYEIYKSLPPHKHENAYKFLQEVIEIIAAVSGTA